MRRRIAMDANRGPQARMPWERRMMLAAQDALNELRAPWRGARQPDEGVDRERGDGRIHHEERERGGGRDRERGRGRERDRDRERERGLDHDMGLELGQVGVGGQGLEQGQGVGAGAPHDNNNNNNEHPAEHDQFIVEERRRARFWGF